MDKGPTARKSSWSVVHGPWSMVLLFCFLVPGPWSLVQPCLAQPPSVTEGIMPPRNLFGLKSALQESYFRFFPIPVFETDPAAGQRYGAMPTFLWFDKKDQLFTIAVGALT